MLPDPISLTWNEALSGIFGSISLASWICLLVPQLIENYQQSSADGISLTFLFIWLLGDVTNLAGAVWARLVPTVIALAVYFCIADFVLISQCLWYNAINRRREKKAEDAGVHANGGTIPSETSPLLSAGHPPASPDARAKTHSRLSDVTEENLGLPGSRRRSSGTLSRRRTLSGGHRRESHNSLERILEEPTRARTWLKNSLSVLAIIAVGTAGWAIAWRTGAWRPTPVGKEDDDVGTPIGAEILGYTSAVLYLGARIPQIVKNQREKSCDGLSLLFFLFSLMGNATYGAGILFHSVELDYFITNLPWLIGSLGTIAEDAIIFIQFSVFGERTEEQDERIAVE